MSSLPRSDARILVYGLLADGLDVAKLTPMGRRELCKAIDKILDLTGIPSVEIVDDNRSFGAEGR